MMKYIIILLLSSISASAQIKEPLGAKNSTDSVNFIGIPAGSIIANSYTPTLFNTTNISSSSANVSFYLRVGNRVFVWGSVIIGATSGSSAVGLGISLPVASNLAAATDLTGSGSGPGITYTVQGDAANDRATFANIPPSTSSLQHYYTFSYIVQ